MLLFIRNYFAVECNCIPLAFRFIAYLYFEKNNMQVLAINDDAVFFCLVASGVGGIRDYKALGNLFL